MKGIFPKEVVWKLGTRPLVFIKDINKLTYFRYAVFDMEPLLYFPDGFGAKPTGLMPIDEVESLFTLAIPRPRRYRNWGMVTVYPLIATLLGSALYLR